MQTLNDQLVQHLIDSTGILHWEIQLWENREFLQQLRNTNNFESWTTFTQHAWTIALIIMGNEMGREKLKAHLPSETFNDLSEQYWENNLPEVYLDIPEHKEIMLRLALMNYKDGNISDVWSSDGDDDGDLRLLIHKTFGFDFTSWGETSMKAWLDQHEWLWGSSNNLTITCPPYPDRPHPKPKTPNLKPQS